MLRGTTAYTYGARACWRSRWPRETLWPLRTCCADFLPSNKNIAIVQDTKSPASAGNRSPPPLF